MLKQATSGLLHLGHTFINYLLRNRTGDSLRPSSPRVIWLYGRYRSNVAYKWKIDGKSFCDRIS